MGHVFINGALKGTLALDNPDYSKNGQTELYVDIEEKGNVDTLVLAGVGNVNVRGGKVRLVDTDAANAAIFYAGNAQLGTIYARSDAQYSLNENTTVDTIYLEGLTCTWEKHGYVANMGLHNGAHAQRIEVYSGFIDIFNGSSVDELYLYGTAIAHLNQGYKNEEDEVPTGYAAKVASAGVVHQVGKKTQFMNGGHVGFHYLEAGSAQNIGSIDTMVAIQGDLYCSYLGSFGNAENYVNLFDSFFTHAYGTLIAVESDIRIENNPPIGALLMEGGRIHDYSGHTATMVMDTTNKAIQGSIQSRYNH